MAGVGGRMSYLECMAQDLERWGRWLFSECGEEFSAPRLLARAAGDLPHQGDEPYTAEPPPVAGTLCMLLLLSRSRGALLVHTCMSSAMRFPYELTKFAKVLISRQTWWYLCYPRQYATLYTCISTFRVLFERSWLFLTVW